jgi:hypothetical protein
MKRFHNTPAEPDMIAPLRLQDPSISDSAFEIAQTQANSKSSSLLIRSATLVHVLPLETQQTWVNVLEFLALQVRSATLLSVLPIAATPVGLATQETSTTERNASSEALSRAVTKVRMGNDDPSLHSYDSTVFQADDDEPVTVRFAEDDIGSEAIPPPSINLSQGIILDEDRLKRLYAETRQVSQKLAAITDQDAIEVEFHEGSERFEIVESNIPHDARFDGLDVRYHAILGELVQNEVWVRSDFSSIARHSGRMPSATLDIVNEWAMDTFGDLILEEDDDRIVVHVQLISSK